MNSNQMIFYQGQEPTINLFDQLLGESPSYKHLKFDLEQVQSLNIEEYFSSTGSTTHNQIAPKQIKRIKTHCTCQKSKCNQKYCPCFKQNGHCNQNCICTDCWNQKFVARRVSYQFGSLEQFKTGSFTF